MLKHSTLCHLYGYNGYKFLWNHIFETMGVLEAQTETLYPPIKVINWFIKINNKGTPSYYNNSNITEETQICKSLSNQLQVESKLVITSKDGRLVNTRSIHYQQTTELSKHALKVLWVRKPKLHDTNHSMLNSSLTDEYLLLNSLVLSKIQTPKMLLFFFPTTVQTPKMLARGKMKHSPYPANWSKGLMSNHKDCRKTCVEEMGKK